MKRKIKKTSWKRLRGLSKFKRRLRMVLYAAAAVAVTAAVLVGISLYQFAKAPFAQARGPIARVGLSPGGAHYNIAYFVIEDINDYTAKIAEISVLSLEPPEVRLIKLPLDLVVKTPLGFGSVRLSDLYALGEQSFPKANIGLAVRTVESLLAAPIDGYVLVDRNTRCQISNVKCFVGEAAVLERRLRTDLDLEELLRVGWTLWRTRGDRLLEVELTAQDFADVDVLDKKVAQFFADGKVSEERLKVMILNGTTKGGLAGQAARFARNLGADVMLVGNDENPPRRKSVILTEKEELYTVQRLGWVLGITGIGRPDSNLYRRADAVVILGLDKEGGL